MREYGKPRRAALIPHTLCLAATARSVCNGDHLICAAAALSDPRSCHSFSPVELWHGKILMYRLKTWMLKILELLPAV